MCPLGQRTSFCSLLLPCSSSKMLLLEKGCPGETRRLRHSPIDLPIHSHLGWSINSHITNWTKIKPPQTLISHCLWVSWAQDLPTVALISYLYKFNSIPHFLFWQPSNAFHEEGRKCYLAAQWDISITSCLNHDNCFYKTNLCWQTSTSMLVLFKNAADL